MKLCFSVVASILCECAIRRGTKHEICRQLLCAFPPFDDIGINPTLTTRLRKGERNVPVTVVDPNVQWNKEDIQAGIVENVLPLLEGGSHEQITIALKRVIASDNSISNETFIDLVSGMTKDIILQRTRFVFAELLTGIVMYVLKYTDNQGTQSDASQINSTFLKDCMADSQTIALIQSYADLSKLTTQDMALTGDDTVLLAESRSRCLLCNRPVGIREGNMSVNRAKFVTLPSGTRIVTCADCASKVNSMPAEEIDHLEQLQRANEVMTLAEDQIAIEQLEYEIEAVLSEVDKLDDAQSQTLRLEPICVESKVQDRRLCSRIRSDVLRLYDGIGDIIDRLSGISAINADRLGRQVNRMYEDAEDRGLSQYQIFQAISERLNAQTGRKYPEACNAIVSYYVQRCDVFREIAQ